MTKRWSSAVLFNRLMVPFFLGVYYLSILLIVVFSPLALLYSSVLCVLAWFRWVSPTQEMLVVFDSQAKSNDYLTRLEPLLEGHAVYLDYSQRQKWPSFSISTQLFHQFGPKPIPQRFVTLYLPAVIVVRKFKWPKKFTFGERSPREENLAALQSAAMTGEPNVE